MIDHVLFEVSDLKKSKAFYKAALKPIGLTIQFDSTDSFVGFGNDDGYPLHLYPAKKKDVTKNSHVAFSVKTRKEVDAFYKAALKAGGKSEGIAKARPEHGPHTYSAYVLDLEGNNIEVVCYRKPKG